MRRIILATLILAPVLAHAQASTPAAGSLQARAEAPHALVAATSSAASASDASTAKTSVRVSTGVSQPKLLGTPHITITESERNLANNTVVVGLLVDAAGKPQDVQIVKSLGKNLDENVLSAVRQFRFQPAQLDAQAIPVHVNLSIILEP